MTGKKSRSLPPFSRKLEKWISSFSNVNQAKSCVRYALALNQLEVNWLVGTLSPSVTYTSQSVFETMEGVPVITDYLEGKLTTLRQNADRQPRAELGVFPDNEPCVLIFQPQGEYDQNWLDAPLAAQQIQVNDEGLICEFLMITCVPDPKIGRRSGIYPGVEEEVKSQASYFIRPGENYQGITFTFYLLDGEISLDRKMLENGDRLVALFPGAIQKIIISKTAGWDEVEEIIKGGFTGFPSVAVFWHDEIIYRHEGLIDAEELISQVSKLCQLYLMKKPSASDDNG